MTEDNASPSSSSEIDRILVDYFRRIDAGEQISVGKFVAEYPDQAATLSDLLYADGKIRARVDDEPDPQHTPTLIGVSAKSAAQPAGSVLRYFGDYELLEEIARGGMGVVYKARQTSLNRTVAIKMILAGNLADENDVKRFHREAEAAANLQHANIVQIFEVGEQADQHYYAMEFVVGQSLADMVRDHPLSVREAATIVRQVANAIEYAHQQGVLHRDLKPANVLVDGRGGIKVTDFGLVKHLEGADQLTTTGQIVGTPSYMPPEQAAGNHAMAGPASDVYSLGAVLYHLLTGRPPFSAATPMETLHQVLEHEPLSPRVLKPQIPKDLETICLKCLEKLSDRRYMTADDLAEELQRFLDGKPIEARAISLRERAIRWVWRHPTASGMAAAAIVAVLALVGLGVSLSYQEKLRLELEREVDGHQSWTDVLSPVLFKGHAGSAMGSAFSLDGKRVISCGGRIDDFGEAILWDSQTGELLGRLTIPDTELPYLNSISVSPVDKRIAATAYTDRTVIVWENDKVIFRFECSQFPRDIAFSPDGTLLAVAESGYHPDRTKRKYVACDVSVWDLETGRRTRILKGNRRDVHRVSFSTDGTIIASGGKDGAIYTWDATTGEKLSTWQTGSSINGIIFLPDGKFIASTGEAGNVHLWDLNTGKIESRLDFAGARGVGLDCSSDGNLIACGDTLGFIRIWNPDRELMLKFKAHTSGVTALAFSGDGKRLVSGSSDSGVTAWNIGTGKGLSGWVPANGLLKVID